MISLLKCSPVLMPFVLSLRNMAQRRLRTLLTCLGVVIGVAVVLAVAMTNASTLESFQQVFDETSGRAEITITVRKPDRDALRPLHLTKIAKQPGVVVAVPSVRVITTPVETGAEWSPSSLSISGRGPGESLQVFGVDAELDPAVRIYALQSGEWLQRSRYEAVISANYAERKELQVGDDLVIMTPGGPQALQVIGILNNSGAALFNGGNVAFVPLTVAQDLFEKGSDLDVIDVVSTPETGRSPENLQALLDRLQDVVGDKYLAEYPAMRGAVVSQMLYLYQQGLTFFSAMALFIGAFLIYNTFSMTVLERTTEIGMLRAIGMSRRQIMQIVLVEAILLGGMGSVAGVVFGVLLGRGLLAVMGGFVAMQMHPFYIPMAGLLQSLGVGLGVTLASAFLPAVQAARIPPLAAIRTLRPRPRWLSYLWLVGVSLLGAAYYILYRAELPSGLETQVSTVAVGVLLLGGTLLVPQCVGWLERWVRPVMVALYRNIGDLGSRNVQRAVGRTTLTVAVLMIGVTQVIGMSAITSSFKSDLESWVETSLGGDLQIGSAQRMREQLGRQIATVPGVAAVTARSQFEAQLSLEVVARTQVDIDTILVNAIDPATFRQVADLQFTDAYADGGGLWTEFAQSGGTFVSTSVADRYNLRRGDELVLLTKRGERRFRVLAVVVDFDLKGGSVYLTREDAASWFGKTTVDRFTVGVETGYAVADVKEEIERRYQERNGLIVATTEDFTRRVRDLSQQSFELMEVLSRIGLVISALGVANTLIMNVLERQREIGGLRSVGMLRRQVRQLILAEAAALGVIGGVFGLGFGTVLAQTLVTGLNRMAGYDLELELTYQPFAWGIFLALVIAQLAALYPAWRAARLNIVMAIQHE